MKTSYLSLSLAALAVAVGFSSANALACTGTPVYALIQVGSSTDSLAGLIDLANDSAHVIGRPTTAAPFTNVDSGPTYCGDDGTNNGDTNYPVSASYYGTFSMLLNGANGRPARIPNGHYLKNVQPNPGTKWSCLASAMPGGSQTTTAPCTDGTKWFYKVAFYP